MADDTNLTMTDSAADTAETTGTDTDFDFENIFEDASDDSGAEGQKEQAETTEAASTGSKEEPAKKQEEEPAAETITAKYNGRSYDLDKAAITKAAEGLGIGAADVVALLQKGMNYDNYRNSVATSNEYKALDLLAVAAGVNREAFVADTIKNGDSLILAKERERLMEKYPYLDDEVLDEMAQQGVQIRRNEALEAAKQQNLLQKQKDEAVWNNFFNAYPELKPKDITKEMFDRVQAGENPIAVYREGENLALKKQVADLTKQVAAMQNNQDNKNKNIGSMRSDAADEADDFLAGFTI